MGVGACRTIPTITLIISPRAKTKGAKQFAKSLTPFLPQSHLLLFLSLFLYPFSPILTSSQPSSLYPPPSHSNFLPALSSLPPSLPSSLSTTLSFCFPPSPAPSFILFPSVSSFLLSLSLSSSFPTLSSSPSQSLLSSLTRSLPPSPLSSLTHPVCTQSLSLRNS